MNQNHNVSKQQILKECFLSVSLICSKINAPSLFLQKPATDLTSLICRHRQKEAASREEPFVHISLKMSGRKIFQERFYLNNYNFSWVISN